MECPKCGKEMEKGIIQSCGSRIIWDKKKHHLSVMPSAEGIELDFDLVSTVIENAYCCKACKTIMFDYK